MKEMVFLSNPPQGFTAAVEACNQLPEGVLAEMCQDVMAFLQYNSSFLCTEHYDMLIESQVKATPKPVAQDCINALTYMMRSACEESLSADDFLLSLKSRMEWSQQSLAVLYHVWKEGGASLVAMARQNPLNIGKLINMEWKVGVSMSSNFCRSLGIPYVTLLLKIAQSNGNIKQHSLEMSISQFNNFAQQLREMSAVLETTS